MAAQLAHPHDDLVRLLPDRRARRSYWTAIHENLRDVARVRAVADFLTTIVREAQADFTAP